MNTLIRVRRVVVVLVAASVVYAQTPAPEPYQFDGRHLAAVRERVRKGDERLKAPLAALEKDAARALAVAPMSVMDKGIVPPSGDKHDYMSQAPYWWPDPSKPNGLPYIRHDGKTNPEITKLSDRTNLGRLGGTVSTLGLAHYFTVRLKPALRMTRTLRMTRRRSRQCGACGAAGPRLVSRSGDADESASQVRAGHSRHYAGPRHRAHRDAQPRRRARRHSADPRIVGLDRGRRSGSAGLDARVPDVDDREPGRKRGIEERQQSRERGTTCRWCRWPSIPARRDLARRTLEGSRNRIGTQIQPDGRQPRETDRTRGYDYSLFNLEAFFRLASLGDRLGVDLWNHRTADGRSLRQALDYLVPYATGEKKWTGEQITEWRPQAIHPLLRRAAAGWKEPRYRELAMKIGGGSARMELTLP